MQHHSAMEQDSETNIPVSDVELSCNTPTTGYYETDFYLDVATPLYSYIQDDLSYMKKPVHPYDKKAGQKHFHLPEGHTDPSRPGGQRGTGRPASRPGMLTLVDQLTQRSMYETFSRSRSQSPGSAMSNDEPIELAHYPDAKVPNPSLPAAIERDDFPAPPHPYSDPERRRRISGRSDDVNGDDDGIDADNNVEDLKLKKEEAELAKIASGIGQVFLHDLQARKEQRHRRLTHPDPRSTSRTPSADREPGHNMRYQNPVNASPSRFLHNRMVDEELFFYRYHGYPPMGWSARGNGTLPATYNIRRGAPELRSSTLPTAGRYGGAGGGSASHSVTSDGRDGTFSSIRHHQVDGTRSEDSLASLSDGERLALGGGQDPSSVSFSSQPAPLQSDPQSPYYRRSRHVPLYTADPDSRYPVDRLRLDRNRRLPDDVDKTQLERHLTKEDFLTTFHMSPAEFYQLPDWRRKKLKRAVHLY